MEKDTHRENNVNINAEIGVMQIRNTKGCCKPPESRKGAQISLPHRTLEASALLTHWSQPSIFQNCKKVNFCWLNHSVVLFTAAPEIWYIIWSTNFYLLISMFRLLTFNVIVAIVGFNSPSLFIHWLSPLFLILSPTFLISFAIIWILLYSVFTGFLAVSFGLFFLS